MKEKREENVTMISMEKKANAFFFPGSFFLFLSFFPHNFHRKNDYLSWSKLSHSWISSAHLFSSLWHVSHLPGFFLNVYSVMEVSQFLHLGIALTLLGFYSHYEENKNFLYLLPSKLVERDIKAVVEAAKGKELTKVIIETCLLTEEEKVRACELSVEYSFIIKGVIIR
jgi:hypothetical protein